MSPPVGAVAGSRDAPLPVRIQQVTFRLNRNGYDVRAVDDFLDYLAVQLDRGAPIDPAVFEQARLPRALKGYNVDQVERFVHEILREAAHPAQPPGEAASP